MTTNTNAKQQISTNATNAVEIGITTEEIRNTKAMKLLDSCKHWEQLNKVLHRLFGYGMSVEFETQNELDSWTRAIDMWNASNTDTNADTEFLVTQWKKKMKLRM